MNLWHPDGKPSHVLEFQLDEHSNTPTAVNVSCMAEERETIRPSRKKMKYRQWMAQCAEVGDQFLLSLER